MTPSAAPSRVFQHPDRAADHWRLRRRSTGRHTRLCEYESASDDRPRVFVKRFRAPVVRIARDSGDPEVTRHLARTLSDLTP